MEDVLVDVLECSVCLNQLDSSARVLPCQHTFCLGCLTDIISSHKELRCPECRVLVTVPIEELPCNILLMRILEGIKNRPQQTQSSTSTPATTDFSYILNLYNTSSVDSSTSTVGSSGPGPRAAPTSESLMAIGSLSLTTNNTGFSNHVLNTIANISNASSFNSSSPQRFSNVEVAETNLVSSSASFVNISSSSIGLSAADIPLPSLGNSHSSSCLLAPTITSVFGPSPSIVNSSVPAVASNNPFLDRSSDLVGNSCSLTSSPVPFMINQNQPLSLHGGSQFLSLGSSSVQQQAMGFPPNSVASLSAAASPTRFLQQNIQQLWQSQPIGREQLGSHHYRSPPLKYVTQYSYLTPSSNVDGSSNLSFSTFLPNTQSNLPSASLTSRSIDPPNQTLFPTSLPFSSENQSSVSTIFSVTSSSLNSLTTTTTSSLAFSPNLFSSNSASVLPVSVPLLSSATSSTDLGLRGTLPDLPSHSALAESNSSGNTSSLPSTSVAATSFSPSCISNISIAKNINAENGINTADYNVNATASVGGGTADALWENVTLGKSSSLFSSTLLTRSMPKTQSKAPVHARALYNYKGNETRDLSFMKGAVISLVRSIDQHWYLGESGGKRGFVPASYVEPLPSEDVPQGIALYDFKMTPTAGGSQGPAAHCLSFNKGDVLLVLRHVDHNWAEGSVCDRVGIFPLAFVQLNVAAVALLQPPTATINVVATVTATTTANSASTASVPSTPLTLTSASPTTRELNARNVAPSICRSPAAVSSSTNTSIDSNISNTFNANINNEPPPLTIPANTGLPTASKGTANNMAMLYVARFSYQPQKADEVALTKGGLYAVTQRCHDGWFKGRCLTTHQTGVFPGNYLHPARGQTIADYLTRRNSGGAADGTSLQRNSNNGTDVTSSNIGSCPTSASPVRSLARRSTVSGSAASPPPLYSSSSCSSTTALDASSRLRLRARRGCNSSTTGTTPSLSSEKVLSAARQLQQQQQQQSTIGFPTVIRGSTTTQAAPLLRERYRCIEAYPASSPRELSLFVGDLVSVVQQPSEGEVGGEFAEGWLYGLLHTTGQQGIFPVTFVEPL